MDSGNSDSFNYCLACAATERKHAVLVELQHFEHNVLQRCTVTSPRFSLGTTTMLTLLWSDCSIPLWHSSSEQKGTAHKHVYQPHSINHHFPLIKINVAAFFFLSQNPIWSEPKAPAGQQCPGCHLRQQHSTRRLSAAPRSSRLPTSICIALCLQSDKNSVVLCSLASSCRNEWGHAAASLNPGHERRRAPIKKRCHGRCPFLLGRRFLPDASHQWN